MINQKTSKKILTLGLTAVILILAIYFAWTVFSGDEDDTDVDLEDDPDKVTIYWFWGEDCPICEDQKDSIDRWEDDSDIEVKTFDVYENPEYRGTFQDMADVYDVPVANVPATFIADEYWIGYDEDIRVEMEETIENCMEKEDCTSPGERLSDSRD